MVIDMQSSPAERFREFLQAYQDENGKHIYIEQVQKMSLEGLTSLFINYDDMLRFDPEIARILRENPEDTLKAGDEALIEVLKIEDPMYAASGEVFHVRISNIPDQVDLRRLRSIHLGELISVEGIIIRQSIVKPLLIQGVFQCVRCGEVHYINQEGGYYSEPTRCMNPNCGKNGPFNLLTEESTYTDLQTVTIQEKPETLPPGQIPRSVPARLVGDLVDTVRAGDRAIVSGILRMKVKGIQKGKIATFDPWLDVNFVSSSEKEFEEIDIDPETEQKILDLSTDINIHRKIIRSLAPSIYGMETIKEALATVLFGGITRLTPDGMKQRGESNLLMIGDPGVAKSQLLQYVNRLAPRGLLTSGKASSAAGLTAAVVRDPDTGEFGLEAGALVLADRGVCMIDEFDKMNPVDRSSIHEAMEQQSYHPSFEILFLNGQKEQIGPFVDNLFEKYIERKIIGKNCEILSTDDLGYNVLTTNFKRIFETNVNRVSRHIAPDYFIKITYSNGRDIMVTPEHPIYARRDGEIQTIEAKDISKDMFVPGPRILNNRNSATLETNFSEGRKDVMLPNSINTNLAKFLGYYVSEGYSYEGSSIEVGLSNTDPEVIKDMKYCIRNTFNIEPLDYTKQNRTLRIISKDVYNYLVENFPKMMQKSYQKRIDRKLFCIDEDLKTEFLRASFIGDGSIESTAVAYSTASRGLAQDYQDLLLTIGISSRITQEKYTYGKEYEKTRIRYKVYIRGDNLERFAFKVIRDMVSQPKLADKITRTKKTNRKHDVLPSDVSLKIIDSLHRLGLSYTGYFNQHIKNNYGINLDVINKYYNLIINRYNNIKTRLDAFKSSNKLRSFAGYSISKMARLSGISRPTVSKYENENKPELLRIYKKIVNEQLDVVRESLNEIDHIKEFRWLKVKNVEIVKNKGEYATHWVYDVTIEPTENFVSHGLILHNTISIAKAGIVAQLNARAAVIAAANPRFGRYEDTRPPSENINLPATILSRFDLIYVIRDEPDEDIDKKMAKHILELRRGHVIEEAEPTIPTDLLRKYISYAKQHVEPSLTDEAMERIEKFYLNLRKESDDTSAIAITPRYLEAIIRLSEAQARMALKEDVTIDHVEAAINLLKTSLEQVGKDPITGRVDIDYLLSGTTKSSRSKMQTIIDIIKEESRQGSSDIVSVKRVKELAKEQNVEEEFVDKVINQLRSNGEIYSPRDGFVKLA